MKKRKKHLWIIISILAIYGVLLTITPYQNTMINGLISCLVFGSIMLLVGLQVVKILTRSGPGLELDDVGLQFNGSALGRKIGKISWQEIQAFQTHMAHGEKQLLVKYIRFKSTMESKGLPIYSKGLDINFYEMETLILHFYHQYHAQRLRA